MNRIELDRNMLLSRIASVVVAVAWLAFILSPAGDQMVPFFRSKPSYVFGLVIRDLLALGCIWFPEIAGSVAAQSTGERDYLPPSLVALTGWLVLLAPIPGWLIAKTQT